VDLSAEGSRFQKTMIEVEKLRQTVTPEEIEHTKKALSKNLVEVPILLLDRPENRTPLQVQVPALRARVRGDAYPGRDGGAFLSEVREQQPAPPEGQCTPAAAPTEE
jgi:hypothetical protein